MDGDKETRGDTSDCGRTGTASSSASAERVWLVGSTGAVIQSRRLSWRMGSVTFKLQMRSKVRPDEPGAQKGHKERQVLCRRRWAHF